MLYSFIKKIFVLIFKLLSKWQVEGWENIPKSGPAILISNHSSYWDPVVLGTICPKKLHFMAKSELFKVPVFSALIKNFGAFPVDRHKSDRAALKAAIEIVERGDFLGMFPEGTRIRTGNVGEFKMGAAMIASRTNAPLIPVALINTPAIFSKGFFRKFKVVVLKPVYIKKQEGQKITSQDLQEVSNNISLQISTILQEFKDF